MLNSDLKILKSLKTQVRPKSLPSRSPRSCGWCVPPHPFWTLSSSFGPSEWCCLPPLLFKKQQHIFFDKTTKGGRGEGSATKVRKKHHSKEGERRTSSTAPKGEGREQLRPKRGGEGNIAQAGLRLPLHCACVAVIHTFLPTFLSLLLDC